MLTLFFITTYIVFGNFLTVIRLQESKRSLSKLIYSGLALTIFQIFVTVSLLGLFPKGISYWVLLIISLALSSVVIFINFRFINPLKDLFFNRFQNLFRGQSRLYSFLFLLMIAGFFLELVFISFKIYFFPNYVWDEMVYHLHPIVVWFQEGKIVFNIETPSFWVNSEVIGSKRFVYWLFIFLGNDAFVNGTQLFGAIILFFTSYRLLSITGVSSIIALCGAFAVFNLPLVLIQTQTNQEHVNLAAFTFLSLVLLIEKEENLFFSYGLIIISIVLMLSTKTSAVIHLLILIPFLIWAKKKDLILFYRKKRIIFIVGVFLIPLVLLIVLIRLKVMKLILLTIGIDFGSNEILSSIKIFFIKHFNILLLNILELPQKILDTGYPAYNADSDSISSFGPFFISFGIIGIFYWFSNFIFRLKSVHYSFNFVVSFAILLQLSYFSFYNSPWNFRLFIQFAVVMILLGYYSLSKLKLNPIFLVVMTGLLSSFCFISASISDYTSPKKMRDFVFKLNQKERTVLNYYQNLRQEQWVYLNEYLEQDEPIAYFASGDGWVYPYFNSEWNRKVYLLDSEPVNGIFIIKDEDLLKLKQKGVRILHARKDNMTSIKFESKQLEQIADGIYLIL